MRRIARNPQREVDCGQAELMINMGGRSGANETILILSILILHFASLFSMQIYYCLKTRNSCLLYRSFTNGNLRCRRTSSREKYLHRNSSESGLNLIGAILIFAGAVAGIVACFVKQLSGLKLIFAIAVLAGAIILVIGFTTNGGIYKAIGKHLLKNAMFGFYLVVVGIVVAVVGALKKA